ncbi:hypothetical protein RHMOL_Rhmol08G0097700 [Rhododendron molle]|uniref:Uncharacterized protein n=1 Tax=Rhododendron molle TaxID=49168 RepID=A0ACC0MLU7_RHOML|nr:hypothetical protein RHMOL_Rhmol08G0097700 [Rhododendron molle]
MFSCHMAILMSELGILACSSCCSKLGNKCPSCSSLVGSNRGVEKILEHISVLQSFYKLYQFKSE